MLHKFFVGVGIASICAMVAIVFFFVYMHAVGISAFDNAVVATDVTQTATKTTSTQYKITRININGTEIHALVADTPALQHLGLGGRTGLGSDEGMFFVFPSDKKYSFWMKDMRFSIDMIWISSDARIVYMAENISPETYPTSFAPSSPARYVLEMTAGYATTHHFKVGNQVRFE